MADKKLFLVTSMREGDEAPRQRIVRATRRSAVENHLIAEVTIAPATTDEAFKAAADGIAIEEAAE